MKYFCSWSGGKDSCLALHRASQIWGPPAALLNMLSEDGVHSRSHGIPREVLQAQADAMGAAIRFGQATWADYRNVFVENLRALAAESIGAGVFGDIDLDEHRQWEEAVCAEAGMTAHLPIWQEDHGALLAEFLAAGFKAVIVTLNADMVPEELLGEVMTRELVDAMKVDGIDVCGEAGEFHTLVYDGPMFSEPVGYVEKRVVAMDKYRILEIGLSGQAGSHDDQSPVATTPRNQPEEPQKTSRPANNGEAP